jgi:hypothetical protein
MQTLNVYDEQGRLKEVLFNNYGNRTGQVDCEGISYVGARNHMILEYLKLGKNARMGLEKMVETNILLTGDIHERPTTERILQQTQY